MTDQAPIDAASNTRFGRTFVALSVLGLAGVLSVIPSIFSQLDALPPELASLPTPLVVALSLANPLILLAVAVAVGTLLAHRVGLRSLVAARARSGEAIWRNLRPHIPMAFAVGMVYAVVVLALDALINPFANAELLADSFAEADILGQLLVGLFYGGIVEELLLRWGLMSLLVWFGWWVVQRRQGLPRPALVWVAIILAAILFGVGHLPAMASLVALTPLIIFRTVLLNALGGALFGWLFWRHNLEVAMVAHAATHVGFFVIRVGLLLLSLVMG